MCCLALDAFLSRDWSCTVVQAEVQRTKKRHEKTCEQTNFFPSNSGAIRSENCVYFKPPKGLK